MMVTGELPVEFTKDGATAGLPRGLSFPFHVSYHDNLGRPFTSTNSVPSVRPNRLDIAQVSPLAGATNETIPAQNLNNGRVVIHFGDEMEKSHLADYLVLSVSDGIVPHFVSGIRLKYENF